ncbi:MAG: FtsX-like permease family protein [Planctomycetes bacterium]|nr:FtsX-like permease family protein [Planctomycetota bacterium]
MEGVTSAVPVKVHLNNCRASLDMVAFQGVPPEMVNTGDKLRIPPTALREFQSHQEAALVGRRFAERRRLEAGDKFAMGGITVSVAGTFTSDDPREENLIYTHLQFLQRAKTVNSLGTVTQIEVEVADPDRAEEIARSIDAAFEGDQALTTTRRDQAFVVQALGDLVQIIRFSRWMGYVCLAIMLVLISNTAMLAVLDRLREHAVLQTLGYSDRVIFGLMLGESMVVGAVGGIVGLALAAGVLGLGHWNLGAEGVTVNFLATPSVLGTGFGIALAGGLVAGVFPSIRASRIDLVDALRSL